MLVFCKITYTWIEWGTFPLCFLKAYTVLLVKIYILRRNSGIDSSVADSTVKATVKKYV